MQRAADASGCTVDELQSRLKQQFVGNAVKEFGKTTKEHAPPAAPGPAPAPAQAPSGSVAGGGGDVAGSSASTPQDAQPDSLQAPPPLSRLATARALLSLASPRALPALWRMRKAFRLLVDVLAHQILLEGCFSTDPHPGEAERSHHPWATRAIPGPRLPSVTRDSIASPYCRSLLLPQAT